MLPDQWRQVLLVHGAPRRKYTAVCSVVLEDGRAIDELIIEEGWIIALDRDGLGGTFEQRIDFDPRTIADLQVKQVI